LFDDSCAFELFNSEIIDVHAVSRYSKFANKSTDKT
jgi:hypothetical protein